MKFSRVLLLLSLLFVVRYAEINGSAVYYQPEQLHLAYPDDPTRMTVTWSTRNDTNSSVCEYGIDRLNFVVEGTRTKFVDGGFEQRSQIIHRVILTNLIPGWKYWYHCGSILGWSEVFFFSAMRNGSNWSPRFALFGDMGSDNAQSLPFLQEEAQRGDYDAIIHVGDFAYDMDSDNGRVGDQFMRQIQPIAGYVPYMVCVGNHEQQYNFSNYKNRFTMPHSDDNMFFSFDVGPVHFISVSTEFYFFMQYGFKQVPTQYYWLLEDLKVANRPENRVRRPWIVLYGHRPMYCSNNDSDDCTRIDSVVRVGLPIIHFFGLEHLLYDYGVDLVFWAHEHSYERLYPIYNRQIMKGSYGAPYTNPRASVHVTTGSAGCQEDHDPFAANVPPWTAFRSEEYGYTRMNVYNSTHMHIEQISVKQAGRVIDDFWIVTEDHGPFAGRKY